MRIRHDRGEGGEALPHDDEQEGEPDQGPSEKAEHRPQVLPWQVSDPILASAVSLGLGWRLEVGRPSAATWLFPALPLPPWAEPLRHLESLWNSPWRSRIVGAHIRAFKCFDHNSLQNVSFIL